MEKLLLSKKQAIAILQQIKDGRQLDPMEDISDKHPLYKLSVQELEKRIYQYIEENEIAGVVEIEQ